ncbi:hypothetical protein D3C86_2074140 [compost metagenome]
MRCDTRTTSLISEEMKITAMPPWARRRICSMISCLAATSMPRVGSSRIKRRGSMAIQRARMAFCWLPPESRPMGLSTLSVLMPSSFT